MRVGILGFGLIGGSVARALHARNASDWTVVAWSPSGTGPRLAAHDRVIVRAARDAAEAVSGADLILLAAPPLDCLSLIDELGGRLDGRLGTNAVVSDVASTKRRIAERAKVAGLRFVGGHPMAGLDQTGYEASTPDLFVDRPWVVCATDDLDATTRVEALALATGARPVRIDPATHDAAVAAISHLPLLVAAALVEAVLGEEAGSVDQRRLERDLASSGWRDATRLARGDVEMGAGIVATNADELAAGIRVIRDVLDRWLTDLERSDGPDVARVRDRLAAARDLLVGEAPASTPR